MKTIYRNDLLKIIAMVTMLVDHLGVLFFPEYRIFRTIGRIAFPIFAFYLAMGYRYTSDKKKYFYRLLVLGIISEVPYMFLNADLFFDYMAYNVVLLFVYALGMLYIADRVHSKFVDRKMWYALLYGLLLLVVIALPEVASIRYYGFYLSYGSYGLIMILFFYYWIEKPVRLVVGYVLLSLVFAYIQAAVTRYYYMAQPFVQSFLLFEENWKIMLDYKGGLAKMEGFFFQARSLLALPFIIVLTRIHWNWKLNRYVAYLFYPVHIIILLIIKVIIG